MVLQVLLFFILVIGSYTSIVNHRFHLRTSSNRLMRLLTPACERKLPSWPAPSACYVWQ